MWLISVLRDFIFPESDVRASSSSVMLSFSTCGISVGQSSFGTYGSACRNSSNSLRNSLHKNFLPNLSEVRKRVHDLLAQMERQGRHTKVRGKETSATSTPSLNWEITMQFWSDCPFKMTNVGVILVWQL